MFEVISGPKLMYHMIYYPSHRETESHKNKGDTQANSKDLQAFVLWIEANSFLFFFPEPPNKQEGWE